MFYRRKIILALLEVFGGRLEKIKLQKLLFLVCEKQIQPSYDFIPYSYGCYSHSAKADLVTMISRGLLTKDHAGYLKKDATNYLPLVKEDDRKQINLIHAKYKMMDANALMKYTYTEFPYYAIKSTTADILLTQPELKVVADNRPSIGGTTLYTIGYEGISLEAYLNKLIKNDVKVLVDVRNNPLSQKFGFSKTQLIRYCDGLQIEYVHYGDVGIQSEYRQELKSQKDYDELFVVYKKKTLTKTISTQEKILDLLKDKKRIALTCFEANLCKCHRKHLADAIVRLPDWNYALKHI